MNRGNIVFTTQQMSLRTWELEMYAKKYCRLIHRLETKIQTTQQITCSTVPER